MTEARKPIKRSKELAPLSREHHDGLLFAWKIREGLKAKVTIARMKDYSIWFWQNHVKPHFYQEEKILLPYMPTGHELTERLKNEHSHIRELVLRLDHEADTLTFKHLADLLDDHIRWEERELFPFIEQSLSTDQLTKVYTQLEMHPVCASTWEDEFWLKK